MRAKQFLTEKPLDPKALFDVGRLEWRPAAFIKKLEDGTPFVDKAGKQYYPEEGEAERLSPIVTKAVKQLQKNPLSIPPDLQVRIKGMGLVPVKRFEKADLQKKTGQVTSTVNVQPIGIGIATQPKAAIKGQKKEVVTTDQAIQDALDQHKEIKAGDLYNVIATNPTLDKAGTLGQAIKQAAKEINEGDNPVVNQYDANMQKTIAIDAGEYLGILAMIKGVADFPKKDVFLRFLKASDLNNLALIFPGEQNASLADSYGVQNAQTGHTIMISSKGGKGASATGAAPAISGLKASIEKRRAKIKPGNAYDFLTLMNKTPTVKQGFVGLNWIAEHYENALPKYIKTPFTENDVEKLITNIKMKNTTPIPAKFKKFTEPPFLNPSKGTDGGKVVYFMTKELVRLVNQGIIPGFRETILELLDENFMQIFTRVIGGKLVFSVLWPGKVDGNVSLHTKMASTDLSQALSFKVID